MTERNVDFAAACPPRRRPALLASGARLSSYARALREPEISATELARAGVRVGDGNTDYPGFEPRMEF